MVFRESFMHGMMVNDVKWVGLMGFSLKLQRNLIKKIARDVNSKLNQLFILPKSSLLLDFHAKTTNDKSPFTKKKHKPQGHHSEKAFLTARLGYAKNDKSLRGKRKKVFPDRNFCKNSEVLLCDTKRFFFCLRSIS
jgi:hypothetical protein